MAVAWDVFDVCDGKILLDAMKNPNGFSFLNCRWRNDKEIASRAIQLYLETTLYTDLIVTTLEAERLRKTKFHKQHLITFQHLN